GESLIQRVTINAAYDQDGQISHYIYQAADVSRLKASEEKLLYMQQHDALTELPNRLLFKSMLEYEISRCPSHLSLAVLMLDLDRFKHVNESLGHRAGDQLLGLVARRLKHTLSSNYIIARVGGDEFAILLTQMASQDAVIEIAEQIIHVMEHPFTIEDHSFYTTGTVGISLYPKHSIDSEILIKNADAAVNFGKDSHRSNYVFYHPERAQAVESWVRLEPSLRLALQNREFELHFQPQICSASGTITGIESLLRWRHRELGLLQPDKFIPILEAIGLMPEVGDWILSQACKKIAQWRQMFNCPFKVAVNVTSQQLLRGNLEHSIAELLHTHKLSPEVLEIEILETVVMDHADQATPLLQRLREMGVGLALDDFGTGHSSLSYLQQLPVQKLKIDKSLVQAIGQNDSANAIIGAVIALGHKLGMTICAEGIENAYQYNLLKHEKCDQLQGFLIAKPMNAEQFEHWLQEHQPLWLEQP
ncbi:MAG: putative bifunctional diguanylate cyclase/phosphodiesterase, partial [Pseudomonadales bacterium]